MEKFTSVGKRVTKYARLCVFTGWCKYYGKVWHIRISDFLDRCYDQKLIVDFDRVGAKSRYWIGGCRPNVFWQREKNTLQNDQCSTKGLSNFICDVRAPSRWRRKSSFPWWGYREQICQASFRKLTENNQYIHTTAKKLLCQFNSSVLS